MEQVESNESEIDSKVYEDTRSQHSEKHRISNMVEEIDIQID